MGCSGLFWAPDGLLAVKVHSRPSMGAVVLYRVRGRGGKGVRTGLSTKRRAFQRRRASGLHRRFCACIAWCWRRCCRSAARRRPGTIGAAVVTAVTGAGAATAATAAGVATAVRAAGAVRVAGVATVAQAAGVAPGAGVAPRRSVSAARGAGLAPVASPPAPGRGARGAGMPAVRVAGPAPGVEPPQLLREAAGRDRHRRRIRLRPRRTSASATPSANCSGGCARARTRRFPRPSPRW